MRPAPFPASDVTNTYEDRLVADPLIQQTDQLWKDTAKRNREIFTEIFRPVPTNLVRNAAAYDVCVIALSSRPLSLMATIYLVSFIFQQGRLVMSSKEYL
jgi:hypothetical protein